MVTGSCLFVAGVTFGLTLSVWTAPEQFHRPLRLGLILGGITVFNLTWAFVAYTILANS